VKGNFHAQFLEGWTGVIPSGYSIGIQGIDGPPSHGWVTLLKKSVSRT
jgi:hypothetical protein